MVPTNTQLPQVPPDVPGERRVAAGRVLPVPDRHHTAVLVPCVGRVQHAGLARPAFCHPVWYDRAVHCAGLAELYLDEENNRRCVEDA